MCKLYWVALSNLLLLILNLVISNDVMTSFDYLANLLIHAVYRGYLILAGKNSELGFRDLTHIKRMYGNSFKKANLDSTSNACAPKCEISCLYDFIAVNNAVNLTMCMKCWLASTKPEYAVD
ncbi:hypothetical protein RJT34_14793 [Clitoria ternatea]|uniref:Cyclotide n=1 Tax=Clitoria ternatea TaxID=43366 RepID=A0AAN9PLF1_CLITE